MTRPSSDASDRPHDEAVLHWLSPEGAGPEAVSQHDVQQLAWYTAPTKWVVADGALPEVAEACARLLTGTGRHRAAAALREHTPEVLEAWRHSRTAGIDAFTRAMAATGVEPPDTPDLTWGSITGPDEATARAAAAVALEAAIDSGRLVPGARSWKRTQCAILTAWLHAPSLLFGGRAPLDAVRAERRRTWAASGPPERAGVLARVAPLLDRAASEGTPAPAPDSLAPLRWILDALAGGLRLTGTGRLPLAVVRAWVTAFRQDPDPDPGPGPGPGPGTQPQLPDPLRLRSESDVPGLAELRLLAARARMTRCSRGRLVLSVVGRAAVREPALLWDLTVGSWFRPDLFTAAIAEVAAALLLTGPRQGQELVATVHGAVAPRFTHGHGTHPDPEAVASRLDAWLSPGRAMGWVMSAAGAGDSPVHRLTAAGEAACVWGLLGRANAPRHVLA